MYFMKASFISYDNVCLDRWAPFFSVLWAIGSPQRFYHRLVWTAETTVEKIQENFMKYSPMVCSKVEISEIKEVSSIFVFLNKSINFFLIRI